jgi:hypothetical protein
VAVPVDVSSFSRTKLVPRVTIVDVQAANKSCSVIAAARCFDAAGVILPGLETTHEARGVVCIQSGVLARRCKADDQNKQKSRGPEYITQGGADGVLT